VTAGDPTPRQGEGTDADKRTTSAEYPETGAEDCIVNEFFLCACPLFSPLVHIRKTGAEATLLTGAHRTVGASAPERTGENTCPFRIVVSSASQAL